MDFLLGALLLASANDQELTGKYVRYEGAEYESAFTPCGSTEVWALQGGPAFKALVESYDKAQKNKYGEVMVSLRLIVTPVDKKQYPQSHYAATAAVASVVNIGPGVTCRAKS